ncbi:MAG: TMEM165/GDT1 family protein [Bacillota bacterium]|nr:TMEM165/GDT1 family protein [Bacillota bacterium]
MDWKTLFVTFGLVFFAELGDKTQLATMTLAAQSRSFWPVFLGSAAALVSTSLLGALLGAAICQVVPTKIIHTVAGTGFIVMGTLLLWGKI